METSIFLGKLPQEINACGEKRTLSFFGPRLTRALPPWEQRTSLPQYLEPWIIIHNGDKFGAFPMNMGSRSCQPSMMKWLPITNLLLSKKGEMPIMCHDRGKKNTQSIGGNFLRPGLLKNGEQVIAQKADGVLSIAPFPKVRITPIFLWTDPLGFFRDVIIAEGRLTGYGLINRHGDYILDPIIEENPNIWMTIIFFAQMKRKYLLINAYPPMQTFRYNSFHKNQHWETM